MRKILHYGTSAALLLAFGLAVISCGTTGKTEPAEDLPNILIINEIENYSGSVLVSVSSTTTPLASMTAVGRAHVSEASATLSLVIAGNDDVPWKDTGEYFIVLIFADDNNAIYFYSGGESSAHKYNFTGGTAAIPLSQFSRN